MKVPTASPLLYNGYGSNLPLVLMNRGLHNYWKYD